MERGRGREHRFYSRGKTQEDNREESGAIVKLNVPLIDWFICLFLLQSHE